MSSQQVRTTPAHSVSEAGPTPNPPGGVAVPREQKPPGPGPRTHPRQRAALTGGAHQPASTQNTPDTERNSRVRLH